MLRWFLLFCCVPLLCGQDDPVMALMKHSADAWNRGDLAAFASDYEDSPDTTFMGGKDVVRGGVQAILERYRKGYPTRERMGTLTFSNIEARDLAPGLVLVTGEFHLRRAVDAGGDANGHYTLILRKTAAGWKIIHDHSS